MAEFPHPSTRKPGKVLVRYSASPFGPVTYRGMSLSQGLVEQRRNGGNVDVLRWYDAANLYRSLEPGCPEHVDLTHEARKLWIC